MSRVMFSLSTFLAVFCTVIVSGVLLSMSGLYEVDALAAYFIAAVLGIDLARRVYRLERGEPARKRLSARGT